MADPSWVWEYVEKIKDDKGTVIGLKRKTYKTTFSPETGTSSLTYHLEKVHKISKKAGAVVPDQNQLTLEKCAAAPLTKMTRELINKQLVFLIADKNLSLSIVEAQPFQRFCGLLNSAYKAPTRPALREMIITTADEKRDSLRNQLKFINFLSISADIWTSSAHEPFIALKVHFAMEFDLRQETLCCKLLPYPHTSENIASAIAEELEKYQIREKVKYIVTDNAANMLRAVNLLKIQSIPCAVHTLQLTVKAVIKSVLPLIKRARKLAKYFRKSPKQRQRLSDYQKLLHRKNIREIVVDTKTRWNSSFLMIQRILEKHDDILGLRTTLKASKLKDDIDDGNELDGYILDSGEIADLKELMNNSRTF